MLQVPTLPRWMDLALPPCNGAISRRSPSWGTDAVMQPLRLDAAALAACEPPGLRWHPPGAQLTEFLTVFCGRDIGAWALARSYGGGLKRSRLRTLYCPPPCLACDAPRTEN